jgi:hypothetical protein
MHVAGQVATALGFIAAKTGCPAILLWSDGRFGLGDHASRRPFIRAKRAFQYPRLARKGWSWFSAELAPTLHKPNSSSGPQLAEMPKQCIAAGACAKAHLAQNFVSRFFWRRCPRTRSDCKRGALLVTKRKSPSIAARPAWRSHRYDRAMPHGDGPKVTRMGTAEA